MKPFKPIHQRARIEVSRRAAIQCKGWEQSFDGLARLAAQIFEAPIALISLIDGDRLRFKSKVGLIASDTPLAGSFCAETLRSRGLVVVRDARADRRFRGHPWVASGPKVRFYAGAPLEAPKGRALGTICVLDRKPRGLSPRQRKWLRALAQSAMHQLELGRRLGDLSRAVAEREGGDTRLWESDLRLQSIIDGTTAVVYVKDTHGRYLTINRQYELLFHVSRADIVGKTDRDIFPWAMADTFRANDLKVLETKAPMEFEEVAPQDDGLHTYISIKFPLFDSAHAPYAVCGISTDITDRKRVEQALIHERNLLHALMDSLPDHIYFKDASSRFTRVNRALAAYFRLSDPAQVVGKTDFDFFSREHSEQAYLDEQEVIRAGRPLLGKEEKETWPDGGETWVSTTKVPLHDPAGQIIGTFGISRDITERKRAERRLAAQYATTRVLAESCPSGETILKILQGVCEALGWELGAAWTVDPEQKVLRCVAVWHRAKAQLEEFDAICRRTAFTRGVGLPGRVWANGEPTWIPDVVRDTNFPRAPVAAKQGLHGAFGFPILLGGEIVGVIEFFSHQIQKPDEALLKTMATLGSQIGQFLERQRAEAALRESEERVRLILDSAAEAIFGMDTEGNCTFSNPASLRLLRYETPDELLGKNMHQLIHHTRADGTPYPLAECRVHQASRRGEGAHSVEEVLWRRDGTSFPAEYWSYPIWRDGKVVGSVVTFLDITDRRAIERMKDEFVSMVSHELRTPLTSIRGALGLLAGGLLRNQPGKAERMLEIAVTNTDRLVRLINDILDIERMKAGRVTMNKEACNAADLMLQASEVMQAMADQAQVTLNVAPLPARLWADPDRIVQTLTNLLGNAIKFSAPSGSVSLAAERRGDEVIFQVKDQGRGIPADKLEAVFETFQQVDTSDAREKGGSGLGLAICRGIVQQHGGRIWAESRPGEGSSLFFTLPALKEEAASTRATPGEATVLICDDDPSIRSVVRGLLEERGYRTFTVGSGREALEQAVAQRPSLILLDLLMPGMSGWETLKALKDRPETQAIPVVILSVLSPGEGQPQRRDGPEQASASHAAGWVRKPIDEARLVQALELAFSGEARKLRVLLVEDDADLARVLVAMFERHGLEIHHAQTGREGIELSQRLAPDLLILDLILPEGDGFEVVDWLRRHDQLRRVPLVVYSVRDLDRAEKDRLRLGPTEFYTKGRVTPEEFEQRIVALINQIMPQRA